MRKKPIPLNKIIINLLVWRLIGPTTMIGLLLLVLNGYQNLTSLKQNQYQAVASISNRIDDFLIHSRQTLANLGEYAQSQPEELHYYLQAVQQSNPYFTTIYYLDENGRIIDLLPQDSSWLNFDLSGQPFLSQVNTVNSLTISRPMVSPINGNLSVFLVMQPANHHTLVGELNLAKVQEILSVSNNYYLPTGEIFVSDEFGTIIAHPDPKFVNQQVKVNVSERASFGSTNYLLGIFNESGSLYMATRNSLNQAKWSVTAKLSVVSALGPYLISSSILLICLLAIWSFVITKIRNRFVIEIVSPLTSLSQSVDLLSCGDFSTPTFPIKQQGKVKELLEISDNFQHMSRAIQARQAALLESERQEHEQRILAEALRDTASALNSTLNFNEVLVTILNNVGKVVPHDSSDIMLITQDSNNVRILAAQGYPSDRPEFWWKNLTFNIMDTPVLKKMFQTGAPLVIPDTLLDKDWTQYGDNAWIQSYTGAPIKVKNHVIGFINLNSPTPGFFNHEMAERLQVFADQAGIALDNARLLRELQEAYDKTLQGWSKALELRDYETEGHTIRVVEMTERLAKRLGLQEPELTFLRYGSLLHDIGKIGIPDSILLKKGPLTDEEWEIMRQHPKHAHEILAPIPYLKNSIDIPLCHHEKWDGSGYPRGLKGNEIPFTARIFSVMDVWDGLISRRPYHDPWPDEKALDYIRSQAGKQFDPKIVTEFLLFYVEELKDLSNYYRS